MKINSEILTQAIDFVRLHPEFGPVLAKRYQHEDVLIEDIRLKLLGFKDEKVLLEVRFDYNIINPDVPPKEDLAARVIYDPNQGLFKLSACKSY
jgi:hypothetical protein